MAKGSSLSTYSTRIAGGGGTCLVQCEAHGKEQTVAQQYLHNFHHFEFVVAAETKKNTQIDEEIGWINGIIITRA